ncbi:T9SS type A sorting domain-containing protein [Marinoscillum furvescens]|nr:T9SS type A sorting domain-containing protein [Marinoscillum furvescens]
MKKFKPLHMLWVLVFCAIQHTTLAQPYFQSGQDPKPSGKVWQKVNNLSDEFNGSSLDLNKWKNTDPSRWIGRAPGIFKQNTVSVANGELRITNYKLAQSEWHNGNEYTHAGGMVRSKNAGQPGWYYEARMKASKTFMSSTFWLINFRNEGSGCDVRVTELDIQECVGVVTSSQGWTQSFDESMHSNTHSRNVTCSTPTGSNGNSTATSGKVYAGYHVYGAWWKSPTEVQFFLDGNHVYTITPPADFDIGQYLNMVTETYDWNPVPADGGMNGTWDERTTRYSWVRTWKLVDGGSGGSGAPVGQTIWLKNTEGNYVWAHAGQANAPLYSNSATMGGWGQFVVEDAGGGLIALKANANGKYVVAENTTNRPLEADRTAIGAWEKFTWVDLGNNQVALKANANNLYVQARLDATNDPLQARASTIQSWETFTWGTVSGARMGQEATVEHKISAYPNPTNIGKLYVDVVLPEAGDVDLELINLAGQQLLTQHFENLPKGGHTATLELDNIANLQQGVYLLRVVTDDKTSTLRVKINR